MSDLSKWKQAVFALSFGALALAAGCQSPEGMDSLPGTPAAAAPSPSPRDQAAPASRIPGESYDQARTRAHADMVAHHRYVEEGSTPEAYAQPYAALDLSALPALDSAEALQKAFASIRDDRIFKDPHEDFPAARRIPWLYPDDGCFTRAEAAADHLAQRGYPPPGKVFVFGDLNVDSPNAVGGSVFWWYHVAPAVRVGAEAYVLDPAIESSRALRLTDWLARMGNDPSGPGAPEGADPRIAICDSSSYDAYSPCHGEDEAFAKEQAAVDMPVFLEGEWDRLMELGRDPRTELAR